MLSEGERTAVSPCAAAETKTNTHAPTHTRRPPGTQADTYKHVQHTHDTQTASYTSELHLVHRGRLKKIAGEVHKRQPGVNRTSKHTKTYIHTQNTPGIQSLTYNSTLNIQIQRSKKGSRQGRQGEKLVERNIRQSTEILTQEGMVLKYNLTFTNIIITCIKQNVKFVYHTR